MRLQTAFIASFKNIVAPQRLDVAGDVTCLIGKNESGKTTILKALHRLHPANGTDTRFDLVTEYPRWRLARDRRTQTLDIVTPITAHFALDDADLAALAPALPTPVPPGTTCVLARDYKNDQHVSLRADLNQIVRAVARDVAVEGPDLQHLLSAANADEAADRAGSRAAELRAEGESARAAALAAFPAALARYAFLTGGPLDDAARDAVLTRVPRFFYFSTYDVLPGSCDLTALASKLATGVPITPGERTVVALLARAGSAPRDFLDEDYDSRTAELQAAGADLTRHVFEYWQQNTDLEVMFDTDMVRADPGPNGEAPYHRVLRIQLRDYRHGGIQTNFATRSSGFQWFFSFFAAFGEHQDSTDPLVVLLDEPGTSLHGEAQKDFVRFVHEELGAAKQTLYTTHSQFMVDPARYDHLVAVHDRATRQNPDLGVMIGPVDRIADRDTVLPVESALGYALSRHLFAGGGAHLAVESASDAVYLHRMTEFLAGRGDAGLDPRLSVIPVGGVETMPAFVALLGQRLKVSALIAGNGHPGSLLRVRSAAAQNGVADAAIVVCRETSSDLPDAAEIEDLFDRDDYLRLYALAFDTRIAARDLPDTAEPITKRIAALHGPFDRARPAQTLTERREDLFPIFSAGTAARFGALFARLNATL